jgi:hypothetical protein
MQIAFVGFSAVFILKENKIAMRHRYIYIFMVQDYQGTRLGKLNLKLIIKMFLFAILGLN